MPPGAQRWNLTWRSRVRDSSNLSLQIAGFWWEVHVASDQNLVLRPQESGALMPYLEQENAGCAQVGLC
jgi:hypothetical protein